MRLQTWMQRAWEEPEVEETCRPWVTSARGPRGQEGNAQDRAEPERPAAATQSIRHQAGVEPQRQAPRDDPGC